jgi:hypothetical protein
MSREANMGDPHFAPHPSIPRGNYGSLQSGWLWKLDMKVDEVSRVSLLHQQFVPRPPHHPVSN